MWTWQGSAKSKPNGEEGGEVWSKRKSLPLTKVFLKLRSEAYLYSPILAMGKLC